MVWPPLQHCGSEHSVALLARVVVNLDMSHHCDSTSEK